MMMMMKQKQQQQKEENNAADIRFGIRRPRSTVVPPSFFLLQLLLFPLFRILLALFHYLPNPCRQSNIA